MTQKQVLLAFAVVVVGLLALLYFLQRPMIQREAALPGVQDQGARPASTPCTGLEGAELERCRLEAYAKVGMPHEYDKRPGENERDASSNTSRSARGSGVEGVSSAGSTLDPPTGR